MKRELKKIFFIRKKDSVQTFRLAMLLCIVGGFLDAYTFTTRGKVLANAQTGNLVYLALNLAERNYQKAFSYFVPIFVFALGILFSEYLKHIFTKYENFRWQHTAIIIQLIVMFFISFIPSNHLNILVNVIISFIAALQYQGFKKIHGVNGATTMCTGNLRSSMEFLTQFIKTKEKIFFYKFLVYIGLITFFVIGATLCAVLVQFFKNYALLVCCILQFIVFLVMFKQKI